MKIIFWKGDFKIILPLLQIVFANEITKLLLQRDNAFKYLLWKLGQTWGKNSNFLINPKLCKCVKYEMSLHIAKQYFEIKW